MVRPECPAARCRGLTALRVRCCWPCSPWSSSSPGERSSPRSPVTPFWPIGTAVLVAAALVPTRTVTWPPEGWRVVVCDVGQGDAVVLRSGADRAVLVDAGPDPPLVDGCLRRLG